METKQHIDLRKFKAVVSKAFSQTFYVFNGIEDDEDGIYVFAEENNGFTLVGFRSEWCIDDASDESIDSLLPVLNETYEKKWEEYIMKLAKEKEEKNTVDLSSYYELKEKHNHEALLLFRCGDFYEAYLDDARNCADVLGVTLCNRISKDTKQKVNMIGFPCHALDTYLPKLIRSGYRVAICDKPKQATEIVEPQTKD